MKPKLCFCPSFVTVSYTHLDVYKRQIEFNTYNTEIENIINTDTINSEWNDKGKKINFFWKQIILGL